MTEQERLQAIIAPIPMYEKYMVSTNGLDIGIISMYNSSGSIYPLVFALGGV